jgi:hypothetical protein
MIIPTTMLLALGYDDLGNNLNLLCRDDLEAIEAGQYLRASGEMVCRKCGCIYYDHPNVQGALWLRRACEGLVKL